MSNVLLPPTSPTTRQDPTPHGGRVLALAVCWGVLAALATGALAGGLTYSANNASCSATSDPWCEVGALLLGAFAGFVAAWVGYLAAGIVTIVRRRQSGERALLVTVYAATPIAASLVIGTLVGLL